MSTLSVDPRQGMQQVKASPLAVQAQQAVEVTSTNVLTTTQPSSVQVQPQQTVPFEPAWKQAWDSGEAGVFPVQPEDLTSLAMFQAIISTSVLTATMATDAITVTTTTDGTMGAATATEEPQPVNLVGVIKGRHLARCDGSTLAELDNTSLEARLGPIIGYLASDYPYVGLLAVQDKTTGVYTVLRIRAIARNGYCGSPPTDPRIHPFENGEISVNKERGSSPFLLWPCFSPMAARTLPLRLWPQQELVSLVYDNIDYETQVQGRIDYTTTRILNELDRLVFVEYQGCGKRHVAWLPYVGCDQCWKIYLPRVEQNLQPIAIRTQSEPPSAPTDPPTQEPLQVPAAQPTAVQFHPQPALPIAQARPDVAVKPRFTLRRVELEPAQRQNPIYRSNLDLCPLRGAVLFTEDGGATDPVTDTERAKLLEPISMGDRATMAGPDWTQRITPAWISPGRIDAVPCSMVIASKSNNGHAVTLVLQSGYVFQMEMSGGRRVLQNGAVKAGRRVGDIYSFWIATDSALWPSDTTGGPFGMSKVELDISDPYNIKVREVGFYPTWSPVYEVAQSTINGRVLLHMVEEDGLVRSFDPNTMESVRNMWYAPVQRLAANEKRFALHRGNWHHATLSLEGNGRYLIISTGLVGKISVVDLQESKSWFLDLPVGPSGNPGKETFGVAAKWTEGGTPGLLAVHSVNLVRVVKPSPDWMSLTLVSEFELPKDALQDKSYMGGPQAAVGWLYGDSLVVSWAQEDPRSRSGHRYEFARLDLQPDGSMTVGYMYDLDWEARNAWPNDIWQCEGNCEGPPLAPPPTDTPHPTNTAVPSPTITPTSVPTVPPPCVPKTQNGDIVLLVDSSGSMAEGDKLKKAQEAVELFVGAVALPPNQIALVSFAGVAGLQQDLTTEGWRVVQKAKALIPGQGTRIDLGLAEARKELNGPRHVESNRRVIVLLSDGQHNGTSVDDVRAEANRAKAAGEDTLIFTIALGEDADKALLKEIATSENHFMVATNPGDLLRIYGQIARELPCPTPTPGAAIPMPWGP